MDMVLPHIVREASQDVLCDFVNGIAFGEVIGIGIFGVLLWNNDDISTRIEEITFSPFILQLRNTIQLFCGIP